MSCKIIETRGTGAIAKRPSLDLTPHLAVRIYFKDDSPRTEIMDPLSIIASSITLITAATAITKKLRSLSGTNDELLVVIDELSDFRSLLQQTKSLIDGNQASIPEDQLTGLSGLLERAKTKFAELDTIIQNHVRSGASGKIRASKVVWMKQRSQIAALRESLRSLKLSLNTLLNNMSV
jgi:hypothetical protein